MSKRTYSLFEIFGAGRSVQPSYTQRTSVDDRLLNFLPEDKHIVIHGPTGHGKSMLIKKYLNPEQYCVVQCSTYHKRLDIYRMILSEADASVRLEKTVKKGKRLSATISIFSGGTESGSEIKERVIDIDLGNINDLIRVLRENDFDKYVVLEDFHYLRKNVQKEILNDLKIILDKSQLRMIFIGIWIQRDKFLHLNGNLGGKINSIRVTPWSELELREFIKTGEQLLNISFSEKIKSYLIENSFGSISILQELCNLICRSVDVYETQPRLLGIDSLEKAHSALDYQLKRHSIRFKKFVLKYAYRGVWKPDYSAISLYAKNNYSPKKPVLNINKWIMYSLFKIEPDKLQAGITIDELSKFIDDYRILELSEIDRYQLIKEAKKISRKQRKMNIHPLIFSFDNEKEILHIVDPLFLGYVSSEDGQALLKLLELIPDNEKEYQKLVEAANAEKIRLGKVEEKVKRRRR